MVSPVAAPTAWASASLKPLCTSSGPASDEDGRFRHRSPAKAVAEPVASQVRVSRAGVHDLWGVSLIQVRKF